MHGSDHPTRVSALDKSDVYEPPRLNVLGDVMELTCGAGGTVFNIGDVAGLTLVP